MDFPAKPNNQIAVLPKRREARLPVSLNVRMLGIDANGKAFHQAAVTLDVSMSGARVSGLAAKLNPGDVIGLQSGGEKCRLKAIWISKNPDGTYQMGLHCQEKGRSPWREMMEQSTAGDRRGNDRYPCNGSVSLHAPSFTMPIWGTLRDISASGCYVQSVSVAAKDEIVSGQFTLNGIQINAVAAVQSSRPTVGMGLQWCDLGWDGEEKLNGILRTLSLNYTETNASKVKALAQVEKLHQLIVAVRERLESNHTMADVLLIGRLSDAQEKLTEALKSMQT
jgi:hypothetical protein